MLQGLLNDLLVFYVAFNLRIHSVVLVVWIYFADEKLKQIYFPTLKFKLSASKHLLSVVMW